MLGHIARLVRMKTRDSDQGMDENSDCASNPCATAADTEEQQIPELSKEDDDNSSGSTQRNMKPSKTEENISELGSENVMGVTAEERERPKAKGKEGASVPSLSSVSDAATNNQSAKQPSQVPEINGDKTSKRQSEVKAKGRVEEIPMLEKTASHSKSTEETAESKAVTAESDTDQSMSGSVPDVTSPPTRRNKKEEHEDKYKKNRRLPTVDELPELPRKLSLRPNYNKTAPMTPEVTVTQSQDDQASGSANAEQPKKPRSARKKVTTTEPQEPQAFEHKPPTGAHRGIPSGVLMMAAQAQRQKKLSFIQEEWQTAAAVLNRLFLITYIVAVVLSVIGIFGQIPGFIVSRPTPPHT